MKFIKYKILKQLPKSIFAILRVFYKISHNFNKANGLICTNSLSYTFLLAFIPSLIALARISDFLPFSSQLMKDVQIYFFDRFLPLSGNQAYVVFKYSIHHVKHLPLIGLLFLVATSYFMMFAIEKHIHQMWHLKRQRKLIYSLLIYSIFFICGPIVAYTLGYLHELLFVYGTLHWFDSYVQILFSLIFTIISLVAVYKFIPHKPVKWKHALLAGTIAGVVFSCMRILFAVYMTQVEQNYSLLYGSLATLPMFILWLYVSNFNLLYCAQIIYILDEKQN